MMRLYHVRRSWRRIFDRLSFSLQARIVMTTIPRSSIIDNIHLDGHSVHDPQLFTFIGRQDHPRISTKTTPRQQAEHIILRPLRQDIVHKGATPRAPSQIGISPQQRLCHRVDWVFRILFPCVHVIREP